MGIAEEIADHWDPRKNFQLLSAMIDVGDDIAKKAAARAPRSDNPSRRGHGADSIRPELGTMRGGELTVNVSWDTDHFYMSFQEFGTKHIRPKMFLLGAARTYG